MSSNFDSDVKRNDFEIQIDENSLAKIPLIVDNLKNSSNQLKILEQLNFPVTNFKLSNIVLTLVNKSPIDKDKLVDYLTKNHYNFKLPKSFSGLSIRFVYGNLKHTAICFKSGKIVFVGVKYENLEYLKLTFTTLFKILIESKATDTICTNLSVSNKVYSFSILHQYPKNLVTLYNTSYEKYRAQIEYNASSFPGMTIRVQNSSAVFLLFNSRKCILTGGKDAIPFQSFHNSILFLKEILQHHSLVSKAN